MKLSMLIASLFTISCASKGLKSPVVLEFKGVKGQKSETRYYSNSRTLTYEQAQLVRDRQEGVDFTVITEVDGYDPVQKIVKFRSKTVRKDGTVSLHGLAFPELREEIDYIQKGTGEILKAGDFPREGLFYVPSLPMPRGPVNIGDTWALSHVWYSSGEGIPLQLEVIGILKEVVPCAGGTCADVELSGAVGLAVEPTLPGAKFSSRLWGRLLFSIERGDILWSEIRSQEEAGVKEDRAVVSSCMISETKLKESFKIPFTCDTNDQKKIVIPVL